MPAEKINVSGLAKAGPYSHAVRAGGLVFLSGLVGEGKTVAEQLSSIVGKAEAILKGAGLGLEDVVKVTVYLASPELFQELNEAYRAAFKGNEPARTTVVAQPPIKGALLEVDIIAYAPNS